MHLGHWTSTLRWKVTFYAAVSIAILFIAPALADEPVLCGASNGWIDHFVVFENQTVFPESSIKFPAENNRHSAEISAWEHPIVKNIDRFSLGLGAELAPRDSFVLGDAPEHIKELISDGDVFSDSFVTGVNAAGKVRISKPSGFYRIVFCVEPSRLRIRKVVNETICAEAGLSIRNEPTGSPSANLQEILEKIFFVKEGTPIARRLATVYRTGKICGDVWFTPTDKDLLNSLYRQAANLTANEARKHIYLGNAACCKEDWNRAWVEFERAYAASKDDVEVANEIASAYGYAHKDLEHCIWLTRFLTKTLDWQKFELAYAERDAIEHGYSDEDVRNEKDPNLAWSPESFPLKVYFPNSELPDYDETLIAVFKRAMAEWIVASEGRIDFEIVKDESKANILCSWKEPEERYAQYKGLTKAPQGVPKLRELGITRNSSSNGKPKRAEIEIEARNSDGIDHNLLHAICLHELGHALGIRIHLKDPSDVMYPYMCEQEPKENLSGRDKDDLNSLYVKHPIIPHAVETYIGLQAECKKLPEEEVLRTVLQASTKQKTADPLESAAILF